MKYQAGFAKSEITAFIPGVGMMGYGQAHNIVKEVATPLWARAMVLCYEKQEFLWVHLEQALVSIAIKEEIKKRSGYSDHQLIITAQHTHAAPGGYSHYPFYNFTIPGFQTRVFETICTGIMDAITAAKKSITDVTLSWGTHLVAADKEIAFNRSINSYLANPEAKKMNASETHLAINREMEGLHFHSTDGKLKAVFNWFGVHCTSISSFNTKIHHDNKGVAAALFEKNHPGTMAFFLQAAAGDVSPNFIWDKSLKRSRGKFADQYESAEFNGELQFRECEKMRTDNKIHGPMMCDHRFLDMAKEVAPPAHGIAFFQGTKEGPGIPPLLANILKQVSKKVRSKQLKNPENAAFYRAHDPKDILLDHRTGSFLGIPLNVWKKIPPIPEAVVNAFRKDAQTGSLNTLPWVPPIIPFHLLRLGELLIAAVPGEITTISAQRLSQKLQQEHAAAGVTKIIISSYANAYMGYITTPEEYRTQSYEAGHTVYGIDTLSGIFTGFKGLLRESGQNKYNEVIKPFQFPESELKLRSKV